MCVRRRRLDFSAYMDSLKLLFIPLTFQEPLSFTSVKCSFLISFIIVIKYFTDALGQIFY